MWLEADTYFNLVRILGAEALNMSHKSVEGLV